MKMKSKLMLSIFLGMVVLLFSSCTPSTVDTGISVISEEEVETTNEEETVSEPPQTEEEILLMTIDELYQFIDSNSEILVVDVRSETNYQEAHIKGAISVPETVISAGEWKPPDGKSLVLY